MFNQKINVYTINDEFDIIYTFELGYEENVQSFFSTIAYNLENNKWGSNYPIIMNEFYKGKLEPKHIKKALKEIKDIKNKLSKLTLSNLVWNIEEIPKDNGFDNFMPIDLDNWFVNDSAEKRTKMTDTILNVLKSHKSKKIPICVGRYHFKEILEPKFGNIIKKHKIKQKIKTVIKYIIYLLIILIIKNIDTEELFNNFLLKFFSCMILAEVIYFRTKNTINSKLKENEEQATIELDNNEPQMMIEKITLKRDLRSGIFDNILDQIDCPKTFDGIKEKLELKKIKNWKKDIEKIHQDLGYNLEYAYHMINDLEEYDEFELYKLQDISKIISKEKRKTMFSDNDMFRDNDIYRIIKTKKEMYILIFKNQD